jgi:hypothetical protein
MENLDITDLKIGEAQIFDVQYYYSGTTLNVSNMIAPYASVSPGNFQHPVLTTGQYYSFFSSTTNPGTYGLGVYNSDGTRAYIVHNTGSLSKIGDGVIFYVGNGFFGTVISTAQGYAYGSSASFTNTRTPTAADLTSYTPAASVPLIAGQSAAQANASNSTPTPNPTAVTNSIITAITPTSNNSPAGETATKAVDGTSTSKYLNFDRANAGFTITLNAGKVIDGIKFTTANDFAPRDPTKFTLYGSNDGKTWTEITANQSTTLSSVSGRFTQTSMIAINNTNPYVYYFITFPSIKAIDTYGSVAGCQAALGALACDSVQIGEVTYYYDSNNTATSTSTLVGSIANPGTTGSVSSMSPAAPTVVSTAPGTSSVSVTETPGTTVVTSANTRGTTTDVTVYNNARGARGTKELTIVRTTTVTSTTPVTTVVTNTTPVTITTVTSPSTVTTYSDGTTTTTTGTPVTTVTTRNDVTTTTTVANDVQVVSTDQNYTTRIDQMDKLSGINTRLNLGVAADPMLRNSVVDNRIANRTWDDRDINAYIYGSRYDAVAADGYTYRADIDTFGAEHRITRSSLVGLQYNRINATLNGTNGGGGLVKDVVTVYGLLVKDDWVLKGDIGQAKNNYYSYHTLPALAMSNSASTKGEDFWILAKLYAPTMSGIRPFVGIRNELNTRNYVLESGTSLTAVDYSLIHKSTETTEYGVRYEHAFDKSWAVAGELSQNSKNLTSNDVALMYNAKNNSTMTVKIGNQRQDGQLINVVQLQARLSF